MRSIRGVAILGLGCGLLAAAAAQPPSGRQVDAPKVADKANSDAVKRIVESLMRFDKNKDGKVTRDEMTDRRLQRLFDRADADKDGVVTKAELTAAAAKMVEELRTKEQPGRSPAPGGPLRRPPSGRGSSKSTPFRPGEILPPYLQDILNLTPDQKKKLEELQKETDTKLDKILSAEQKKQLKEMSELIRRATPPPPPGDGKSPPRPPLRK